MSFLRKTALLAAVILIFILSSCADESSSTYSVITPTVNPGDFISGDDFVMVSAFAESEYTVRIIGTVDTSDPGVHHTTITVTDSKGNERTHSASYNVRSYLRDSLRIEAGGSPAGVYDFVNRDVITDPGALDIRFEEENITSSFVLGTHRIGIYVGDILMYSTLIIEDTVAPTAEPVTVYITNKTGIPSADAFVTNIVDATTVSCRFKENYNFNTTDDIYVTVILTDEGGNETEIQAFATCSVDTEPPVISGVHNITVIVGETVSYKDGITVSDNSGENVKLSVDNSRVDLNTVGTYEVTYTATDSAGNSTLEHATVNVIEQPSVSADEMEALAKSIYKEQIKPNAGSSQWDRAYAIYTWTHDNIKYADIKVDKENSVQAAYDGMMNGEGDCFTYMAVSEVLLKQAGIKTQRIERLKKSNESAHYWLLVDIGDGWYHFDSCWHFSGKSFESFMRTDAELSAYCEANDLEYYYRFDKSKYPKRATESYYTETPEDTSSNGETDGGAEGGENT